MGAVVGAEIRHCLQLQIDARGLFAGLLVLRRLLDDEIHQDLRGQLIRALRHMQGIALAFARVHSMLALLHRELHGVLLDERQAIIPGIPAEIAVGADEFHVQGIRQFG